MASSARYCSASLASRSRTEAAGNVRQRENESNQSNLQPAQLGIRRSAAGEPPPAGDQRHRPDAVIESIGEKGSHNQNPERKGQTTSGTLVLAMRSRIESARAPMT